LPERTGTGRLSTPGGASGCLSADHHCAAKRRWQERSLPGIAGNTVPSPGPGDGKPGRWASGSARTARYGRWPGGRAGGGAAGRGGGLPEAAEKYRCNGL